MRITALTENTTLLDFPTEHGLSLYIETGEKMKILFDTGQSNLFVSNAEKLGIRIEDVDLMVLSHGHYDHGGGILRFLEMNDHAPVYISKEAFRPFFDERGRYIGLDPRIGKWMDTGDRLVLTEGTLDVGRGMTLYSPAGRIKKMEMGYAGLLMQQESRLVPDAFLHEQYLMIEEGSRRVLFSGCSHQGILNIMDWFHPDVMVGGFHFMDMPLDETLKQYALELNREPAEYYTCHCTGIDQYRFIEKYMDRLRYLSEGMSIEI